MLGLYQYLHASILKVVSSHLMVQLELIIIPDCFTAYNLTSFKKTKNKPPLNYIKTINMIYFYLQWSCHDSCITGVVIWMFNPVVDQVKEKGYWQHRLHNYMCISLLLLSVLFMIIAIHNYCLLSSNATFFYRENTSKFSVKLRTCTLREYKIWKLHILFV